MVELFSYIIDAEQASVRLDHFLVQQIPDESRSRISKSVQSGLIRVDGKVRKNSYRLKTGETISGSLIVQSAIDVVPEEIDFDILFEDEFLLAVSKPPNLVVHPGSGHHNGTLVNGLVHYCASINKVGDPIRPGLVHRLDKDTSGIMLVAKQNQVHRRLIDDFQSRSIDKYYIGLLSGILSDKQGRIVANIGRHPIHRQKMAIRQVGGKFAATSWRVIDEFDSSYSLVRLKIETGRTHQIRVHMGSLGYPVAGDRLYGKKESRTQLVRQMLHAAKIRFIHPITEKKMVLEAPLWPDFAAVVHEFEQSERARLIEAERCP